MLLSIIIPVYNTEKFLAQCIESVLNQTLTDLELILVDDGSPDGSGRICDSYREKYSNIKVIHKENQGLTEARKTGLRAAEGEFISFVDSDDWIDPDFYGRMVELARENGADIVSGGYISEQPGNRQTHHDAVESGVYRGEKLAELQKKAVFDPEQMCQGMAPSVCTKVFRRETALGHFLSRTDRVSNGEDTLFTYPVLFRASCVVIDHQSCGYHYRILGNSMSHAYSPKYLSDIHTVHDILMDSARDLDPAIRMAIAYDYIFLLHNCFSLLMGRGNRMSYPEKYRTLRKMLPDQRLQDCAEQVNLDRFPKSTAAQLKLLSRNRPGLYFLHYFRTLVFTRLSKVLGR